MTKRTNGPAKGRANAPSTRSLGPAQERPDPGLEILFRWLERQPRRTPAEQVALARAYQARRLDLWRALLRDSAHARAVVEDEAERAGFDLPPAEDAGAALEALAAFARSRDAGFRLSREFPGDARAERAAAERARKTLCESNLRLVVTVAKRYRAPADPLVTLAATLPFSDLIQEGTAGLLRACDLFDPELGWKFSTYACWWIRHGINRALADQSRTVRIPPHVADQIGKASRAEGAFLARCGRLPTDEELAEALQISAQRAGLARRATAAARVLPLDPPEEGGEGDGAAGGGDARGADEGTGRGASECDAWREAEAALLRAADGGSAAEDEEAERLAAALAGDALDALAPRAAADAAVLRAPDPTGKPARPVPARSPGAGGAAWPADCARMRAALELRWGMRGRALTYDEVAECLGVGREGARKLCAGAEAFVRVWAEPERAD